jgi:hypothetical protein
MLYLHTIIAQSNCSCHSGRTLNFVMVVLGTTIHEFACEC